MNLAVTAYVLTARGLHPGQRLVRRPFRRPPDLRLGAGDLHGRIGAVRVGGQLRRPGRHAGAAGDRRRDDDAGRPADPAAQLPAQRVRHRHDLHDAAGHPGAGRRSAARGTADDLPVLALDLLRQPALRACGHFARPTLRGRRAAAIHSPIRLSGLPDGRRRRRAAPVRAGEHQPPDHSSPRHRRHARGRGGAPGGLRRLCPTGGSACRRPRPVPFAIVRGRHAGRRPLPRRHERAPVPPAPHAPDRLRHEPGRVRLAHLREQRRRLPGADRVVPPAALVRLRQGARRQRGGRDRRPGRFRAARAGHAALADRALSCSASA